MAEMPPIERAWDRPAAAAEQPKSWWQRNGKGLIIIGAVVVLGLFGAAFAYTAQSPRLPSTPSTGDSLGAWAACQEAMNERLKAPATADYPTRNSIQISQAGSVYTINGYVDAENGFGANVRTNFTCTATWAGGDSYRIVIVPEG